jgi:hypothetical protein
MRGNKEHVVFVLFLEGTTTTSSIKELKGPKLEAHQTIQPNLQFLESSQSATQKACVCNPMALGLHHKGWRQKQASPWPFGLFEIGVGRNTNPCSLQFMDPL